MEIAEQNFSNLYVADGMPPVTGEGTLKAGLKLTPGAVLGKDVDGKLVLVNSAAAETATKTAYGVLINATDATTADTVTAVVLGGTLNENVLTFGGTDTADTHRADLRLKGIYIKPAVKA